MSNKNEFLAHSNHLGSSMVILMISSMNTSIEVSFALMSTARWYTWTSGYEGGRYSSLGSNCLCVDWRSFVSHVMSVRISLPRCVSASMMVVYSTGAVVVPKGKHMQRKANMTTIMMHVDAIFVFMWMHRYAASRSVFTIRMRFEGHLILMAAIMWIILSRQEPPAQRLQIWARGPPTVIPLLGDYLCMSLCSVSPPPSTRSCPLLATRSYPVAYSPVSLSPAAKPLCVPQLFSSPWPLTRPTSLPQTKAPPVLTLYKTPPN